MNRKLWTLALFSTAATGLVAYGQSGAASTVAQPAAPAPAVVTAPAPTNANVAPPAPAVVQPPAANSSAGAEMAQVVYSPKLPTPDELRSAAAAQGFTVERIVQTGTQVIAFYRNASGQPVTVAYQPVPPSSTTSAQAAPQPPVVVAAPAPAVVYETAPRVVYYDPYPRYYYPRVWYPPVSFSFGFGYRSFHGGHRHW